MSDIASTVCSIGMIFCAIIGIPIWMMQTDVRRIADALSDLRDVAKGKRQ